MTTTTAPVRPNPKHPAAYSKTIVEVLDGLVRAEQRRLGRPITVFDPMAGVGRIHRLAREGKIETFGMELEPSWAACHERTACGDSIAWMGHELMADQNWHYKSHPQVTGIAPPFDVIASSPPYGNRFSDSHDAQDGSRRRSYAHDLAAEGYEIHPDNAGTLPWGPRYWTVLSRLYRALPNVLADGGLVLWNVSDFVKDKALVPAVMWHRGALNGVGFYEDQRPRLVETERMSYGENREARAPSEVVLRLRYGGPTDG